MKTPKQFKRSGSALAALLTGALAFMLIPAEALSAPQEELVVNGEFAQGASGWRTNSVDQNITILDQNVAQLTTRQRSHAVLNDRENTVPDAELGARYTVTARVRTTTPNVWGAVRVREVSGHEVAVSQTPFSLRNSNWKDVSLELQTVLPDSHLDLNVVAWNLPSGKNLQIESVSMKDAAAVDSPPPVPPVDPNPGGVGPEAPAGGSRCETAPPAGTVFGASLSTRGHALKHALAEVDDTFGTVDVVRHFRPGLPLDWDSEAAQQLTNRTLVTSFKAHPRKIMSGELDAFFSNWFKSAPSDQTIYWSYFHEPEDNINAGEFTASQYRAAWKRLAELEQEACKPNLHATLILTEWTMRPASKRDFRVYDAGPDYIKVLAFDPYNGATSPTRDFYKSARELLEPIVEKVQADGRPWAIAELGSRQIASDQDGKGRAQWLTSVATYAKEHDALFVTYFHSIAKGGDFRLLEPNANAVWRKFVAESNRQGQASE